MARVRIKKLDADTAFKPFSTVLLIGKRNTGKSVAIRDILYHLRDKVDVCVIFSPTECAQGTFSDITPATLVHPEFSDAVLETILETQRRQWKRPQGGKRVYIVIDDCAFSKSLFTCQSFKKLLFNGRHLRTGLCLTTQFLNLVPPSIRTNIDVVCAAQEKVRTNKERLWKQFFGVFPTFSSFDACFSQLDDYKILVLRNDIQSSSIDACVFWWRAVLDRPPFRVGADWVWDAHARFGTAADDDDNDDAIVA